MAEKLDTDKTLHTLAEALTLQAETILTMTHLAGTLRGLDGAAIKSQLRLFVAAELEDAYLLMEKFSALGGELEMDVPAIRVPRDTQAALEHLVTLEHKAVSALHAVIPHTGQEPRSEALEHRLEHPHHAQAAAAGLPVARERPYGAAGRERLIAAPAADCG